VTASTLPLTRSNPSFISLTAASSFGASSLRATNSRVKFSLVAYAGERHLTAELTVRGFLPSSRRWLRRPWWEAIRQGKSGGGAGDWRGSGGGAWGLGRVRRCLGRAAGRCDVGPTSPAFLLDTDSLWAFLPQILDIFFFFNHVD